MGQKNPESYRPDIHIYYRPSSCNGHGNGHSSRGGITYYVNKLLLFFVDWFFWLAKDLHRFAVALCGPLATSLFISGQPEERQSIDQSHNLIKCKHLPTATPPCERLNWAQHSTVRDNLTKLTA